MLFALIGEVNTGINGFIEELGKYAYFQVLVDEECYANKHDASLGISRFIDDLGEYTDSDDLYAYVITEPQYLKAIPENTPAFLFTRDLDGILDGWRTAFGGHIPFYYKRKYTKRHGCLDNVPNVFHFEYGKQSHYSEAMAVLRYLIENTKTQYKWLRDEPLK